MKYPFGKVIIPSKNNIKCPYCDSVPRFTSNSEIYGREYGSGRMYICDRCKAYTGTHQNNPKKPMGNLADNETRELRKLCHENFDPFWKNGKTAKIRRFKRNMQYKNLRKSLGLNGSECHFGYFNKHQCKVALESIKTSNGGTQWRRVVN